MRRGRPSLFRSLGILLLLIALMYGAWWYGVWTDERKPVPVDEQKIHVADGDSFAIGDHKLRLNGIDAPEYAQECSDENGKTWACGKAARASLEQYLLSPGLACTAEVYDRYARSIATCSVSGVPDIAAAQVAAGMAISHEFAGMRDYGEQEDAARSAKRGIWRGKFILPAEYRDSHPSAQANTPPNPSAK